MADFAYNNAKNTSISHTLFKFNCKYHPQILFKNNVDSHSQSFFVNKIVEELKKLIEI